jgi:hypothetical protein
MRGNRRLNHVLYMAGIVQLRHDTPRPGLLPARTRRREDPDRSGAPAPAALRRHLPPARHRRRPARRIRQPAGPGRALRGDSPIQRGRPDDPRGLARARIDLCTERNVGRSVPPAVTEGEPDQGATVYRGRVDGEERGAGAPGRPAAGPALTRPGVKSPQATSKGRQFHPVGVTGRASAAADDADQRGSPQTDGTTVTC